MNYIATWFYRESADEASFYPQMGQKGDSALVHSVYMQIQVPFFRTFRHYNPAARLLFFTNLKREGLPRFLLELFDELSVETVTLPYTRRPPKGCHFSMKSATMGVHSMSLSPTVPLLLTASPCRRWKRSTKPATANLPVCHLLTTEGNSSG